MRIRLTKTLLAGAAVAADDRTQVRGRGADDATSERRLRGTDDGPNHS
jgi:hypothetical protein